MSPSSSVGPRGDKPDRREDGKTFVVGFRFNRPAPLDEWALLFGDALHNWRSAQDHAVCAMAIHDTQSDSPPAYERLQVGPFGFLHLDLMLRLHDIETARRSARLGSRECVVGLKARSAFYCQPQR